MPDDLYDGVGTVLRCADHSKGGYLELLTKCAWLPDLAKPRLSDLCNLHTQATTLCPLPGISAPENPMTDAPASSGTGAHSTGVQEAADDEDNPPHRLNRT